MPTHQNNTNLIQGNLQPECQISHWLGAEGWTGYGAAPAKCVRPISPSLILWFVSHQGEMNNGLSGGITSTMAGPGFSFCNTTAIMASSATNSLCQYLYTNGESDFVVSCGVASYNFSKAELGYLGKKGGSDANSYAIELNNASSLGLSFPEYNAAFNLYSDFSQLSGVSVPIKNYTLWSFIKNVLLP